MEPKKGEIKPTSLSWSKKLFYAVILTIAVEWIFIYIKFGEIIRPLSWDLALELIFSFFYFASLVWGYPYISAFIHSEKISRLKTEIINLVEGISVVLATLILTFLTKLLPLWVILWVLRTIYDINAQFDVEAVRRNIVVHAILGLFFYYFVERERITKKIQAEHLRYAELQKEEFRGQLEHLEDQVNPGFLFHCLETLEDLIQKNENEASHYVNNLSLLYRSFLNQKEQLITLKHEVNAAKAYIELLKAHFHDDLVIHFRISEEHLEYQLPPGSLHLILEKIISPETSPPIQNLIIEISSADKKLTITAHNLDLKTELSSKNALKKIEDQYRFLSSEKIEINPIKDGVVVKLPLLQTDAEERDLN